MAERTVTDADQILVDRRRLFDDARNDSTKLREREQSLTDRNYYDGYQLTETERRVLRKRRQPEIVLNHVRRGVDGILGVVSTNPTDPRAYSRNPPNPQDQPQQQMQQATPGQPGAPQPQQPGQTPGQQPLDAGDIASMTLRYVANLNRFDMLRIDLLENILIEGTGAAIVETGDNEDVLVTQIRWEEFFADPRSRRSDYKDARYMGVAKWIYADTLAAMYPESKDKITGYLAVGSDIGLGYGDLTWEDRPNTASKWLDRKDRRVMVVEMYFQEAGDWKRTVFWAGDILEDGPSPYKDDRGVTICPIEAQSAYVDRENLRYGIVRDMRGPQDEINMRRAKALHEANVRQVQQVDFNAPPIKADTVRAEAARPDGVIPTGWQVVPRNDVVAANMELLAEAKAEIERFGPNPAILGRQGADASGRAQQVRQQAGMTELARVLSRAKDLEHRLYKQMWARARTWSDPKWIRVTDDEGAAKYVRVNEPTEPVPMMDPQTGQLMMMPGKPKNHIAEMDIDIVLDDVPDTATLEQEVFTDLARIAGAYGPQAVPFEMMIEMSSLPKKREILQKLEEYRAQQAQSMQQANGPQQQQMQAEMAKTMAEVNKANEQILQIRADILEKESMAALNFSKSKSTEIAAVSAALDGHMNAVQGPQPTPGESGDTGAGQPQ